MPNAVENLFPGIFCIEDVLCITDVAGCVNCRATLYHDQACVTVSFNSGDRFFENGEFVAVRWLPEMHSDHGAIRVAGLTLLDDSVRRFTRKDFNPFLTVPPSWNIDRHLICVARDLWGLSSRVKRQRLFSAFLAQARQRNAVI